MLVLVCGLAAACSRPTGKVRGVAPRGEPHTVLAVQAGDAPTLLTVRGRMIEKCPVAGCWFRLDDETGIIKVDTKSAGFVVTDIPLNTLLTVGGKIGHEGQETIIEATGLRY